jgi:hypothetical protein
MSGDTPESGDKPLFEARELSDPGPYKGPERRKGNRRSGVDRRKNIRFEIDKEDRRKSYGRRKGDCSDNLAGQRFNGEAKSGS